MCGVGQVERVGMTSRRGSWHSYHRVVEVACVLAKRHQINPCCLVVTGKT